MKNKLSILSILFTFAYSGFSQCNPSGIYYFNGNANEASGYGKNGVVYGATLTKNRHNVANSAYYFDGVNDKITIPDDTSNDLSKTWTIMAWIKPDFGYGSFQDNHVSLVEKWGNAGSKKAAYGMGIHSGGQLEGFTHTGISGTYKWSISSIDTAVWTHVAVTRSDDDSIRLYINGTLNITYYSVLPQNSEFNLSIGMAADSSIQKAYPTKYRFKGAIDDVKIYKCALIPSQFYLSNPDINAFGKHITYGPNPTSGIVQVFQNFSSNYKIEIYDITGKLIHSGVNETELNLVNHGIYNILFTDLESGFTNNQKIIVE
jgi:hypothetical protein